MSNKEILEKAISQAIDGGWIGCQVTHSTTSRWLVTNTPRLCVCFSTGGNGYYHPNEFIFDHDFAKALWGVGCSQCGNTDAMTNPMGCGIPEWAYRLKEMVTSEDPIKYLGQNL